MKKFIGFLLCLMMLLSLVSCSETKNNTDLTSNTENPNKDVQDSENSNENTVTSFDIYKSVLEVYKMAVNELKDLYSFVNANPQGIASELFGVEPSTEKEWFLSIIDPMFDFYGGRGEEDSTSPHHKLSCGYAIKDLNGDGVDELVLLTDDYMVCAIFSITDGKPVLLGNYRTRHSAWIDEKGWIYENGSGGADYSMNAVYKISNGGASKELIVEFGTNGHEWIGDTAYTIYYKLVNGEKETITESEYLAFNEQYNKYLGSQAGAEATKNDSGLTFISLYTEAEIAMEMYEAAINDEICVLDKNSGEMKLKDCCFPSDHLRLGECDILSKAILDLDGDGINEYVIQSPGQDHIVLRYYDGKVYSYCFDKNHFYSLNTDGCFYWSDSYESENWFHGCNQITFNGSSLKIKEIYRIKHIRPLDFYENLEFYVDGKQLTRKEFLDYNYYGTLVIFSPLDISCEYPISSEKAYELASDYWGFESGMSEGAAGRRIVNKIVILEKPNSDSPSYRIGWQAEGYRNHVPDSAYSLLPASVVSFQEIFVDAFTGEVREYDNITSQPENDVAMQMYEAAIKGEICVFDELLGEIKLKDCQFPSDNLRLDECEILSKAILDLDGDGVNEYIIKSPNNEHIILHYYNGKVYSYGFDSTNFYNLNTDGTFYWHDFSVAGNWEGGLNKISFDGETLTIKNIYSIQYLAAGNDAYYLDGESVTRDKYLVYHNSNHKTKMSFSPFELTCSYPITAEQAWKIANTYWNDADCCEDRAAGTTIISKVVLLDTPNSDTDDYRVALQMEYFLHGYDGWESNPPHRIKIYAQLLVNAFTGEVREYVEPELDGK